MRSPIQQVLLIPENRSADRGLQKLLPSLKQKKPKLVYLYGPTGVGKTQLITQALRGYLKSLPKLKYRLETASQFAAKFAEASDARTIPEFQRVYRSLDFFICEDLQSIQRRKETQQQLVAILDELESQGAVVLLSATQLPGRFTGMNRKLVDRCRAGLCLEVTAPASQSRLRLCSHFAQELHEPLPTSVLKILAEKVHGSPRDLLATIERLLETAHRRSCSITSEFTQKFLKQEVAAPELKLSKITRQVAKHFDLKIKDLKSSSRRADIVLARQCAMYLARQFTSQTQQQIASFLGKSDHTSVIRACQKIEELVESDSDIRHHLSELKKLLESV